MIEKKVVVKNKDGLYARLAAVLVQVASKYSSKVWIKKDDKQVNAKSIMGIMSLGISQGETVVIGAEGKDEQKAVEELYDIMNSEFKE
ncbi:MAG: HPr family phosphocarrier protein [Clostridia bacterium]|nr:HPr family phosphocarrier protein [Clostridia bacterium]